MTVKFREVGNSITVTIPKEIVTRFDIRQGMEADITATKDIITVKPISKNEIITIKSLFLNYNGNYKPSEIDWGGKKGNEAW